MEEIYYNILFDIHTDYGICCMMSHGLIMVL